MIKQNTPVVMALNRDEVDKLLKAMKTTHHDFFKNFESISIQQLKTDENIFDVNLGPKPGRSFNEILETVAYITGIYNTQTAKS